jgi:hypothetical protein
LAVPYGVSWFLGSSLMEWLYERSHLALVGVSAGAELAAIPLILLLAVKTRKIGLTSKGIR